MNRINLILDTDIGPDCDDAGALACVHSLQTAGYCNLLAVTHCTSNPYGAGCIDAINRWYGCGSIPVGTLKEQGFLSLPEHMKYNRYIAQNYPNRYADGEGVPCASGVLRETLAKTEDASVVICAIGPLVNLYNLLHTAPDELSPLGGPELILAKCKRLVVMGGGWKGPEWNFQMHPMAAREVCSNWPTEIWFSTFDIGQSIMTGKDWACIEGSNPVYDAYRLYSPGGRMSWDQTAVLAAVLEPGPFFSLSERGIITVSADGTNTWQSDQEGKHRYINKLAEDADIARYIDKLMGISNGG